MAGGGLSDNVAIEESVCESILVRVCMSMRARLCVGGDQRACVYVRACMCVCEMAKGEHE